MKFRVRVADFNPAATSRQPELPKDVLSVVSVTISSEAPESDDEMSAVPSDTKREVITCFAIFFPFVSLLAQRYRILQPNMYCLQL